MSRSLLKQHLALVQQSLPVTREQAKTQQQQQQQQQQKQGKGKKRKQEAQPETGKRKKSYLEEARQSARKKKNLRRNIALLKAVGPPTKGKIKKAPIFKRTKQIV